MLSFIVRSLIAGLSPTDLIELGAVLQKAGYAAQDRQKAIADALAAVRAGLSKLTK